MRILVNLATLKRGGGQTVGLNFLTTLFTGGYDLNNFIFVATKNSEIHKFLSSNSNIKYFTVPKIPIQRMLFEFLFGFFLIKKLKIDVIYTIFGLGLYPRNVFQVIGSADSNLFFPEIDFWEGFNKFGRLQKKLIDKYRIFGLKRASAVIFENESMLERAKILFKIKKAVFIKPSFIDVFNKSDIIIDSDTMATKGLFFCGWQKNKNYLIVPRLAYELKKRKINYQFIITANKDFSTNHLQFSHLLKKYDVENMVAIIGEIRKEEISSLYGQVSHVFLLSKLESFSNNILECWYFKKPLIISDEIWSNSICKDAAFYVNRNNVGQICNVIEMLLLQPDVVSAKILSGIMEFGTYPLIHQKIKQELDFIKQSYESR
jgi:glycosyltransferase involved in cell wall biosynthesis